MSRWLPVPDLSLSPDPTLWNVRVTSTRGAVIGYILCVSNRHAVARMRELRRHGHLATVMTPESRIVLRDGCLQKTG